MQKLNELINNLASTLGQERNTPTFYQFVINKFNGYVSVLQDNADSIDYLLQNTEELRCKKTSIRFINLIKSINKRCIEILSRAYKGDLLSATAQLKSLLVVQKYTYYKLMDVYANYLQFKRIEDYELFRCVDFKSGEVPVSCNHVPFNLRHLASKQRFNQIGVPCLYLSTSLDCCQQEIGDVAKENERWYGTFKAKRNLFFADFTIPSPDEVKTMSFYDKFSFLVTYPLRLLCLTKAKEGNSQFVEEYLFSQLFLHVLFLSEHDNFQNFDGICYTSMKDGSCLNFVIPAKYQSNIPPVEGLSDFIESIIEEKNVTKL